MKKENSEKQLKAVCLLSGGLDSATALYAVLAQGYAVTALTVYYGQRHERELQSARALAAYLNLKHHVLEVPLPWKGSALLDASQAIPEDRPAETMSAGIPATYVPARNTILLSLAASLAETEGAEALVIGANILDYSGYPDCRPEYFEAFEKMITLGTKAGSEGKAFKILAPLVRLSKKQIIEWGMEMGVPYEKTWSCYQGGEQACGRCDSCLLRARGFEQAGLPDPLLSHEASRNRR